ncbi:MAG: peptide chain release factor 1 [Chthonomonadales bacterium]|nr:peptide chain release factor 1 [Chthonomonadales bacterium]
MPLEPAIPKLDELEARYEALAQQMMTPEVAADPHQYHRINKSWSDLTEVVEAYREYRGVCREIVDTEELLADAEMRELAQADLEALRPRLGALEDRLKLLLMPRDPNDEKSVIVEIRPAAGGEEAALFAGDLLRMYTRYAERRGWKVEVMSAQETGIGGFSDAVLSIQGRGAYSQLKFESGVHRVQRVPVTESSGRIHTSTVTVAVLPEAEEVEVQINPNDIDMDVYHSSSAGGQNVQKVATAIRILHKPSGIVVTCQDERSQLQNKEKAMRMLRARLYERELSARTAERTETRRSQVGSGDRSEKIRTYNFPDGRVTDHRVGVTIYNMPQILDGGLQPFVDALVTADQADRLGGSEG